VGRYYRVHLLAGEGRPPYRWQVVRGTLPSRLRLTRDGVIAGRPSHAGAYSLLIRVRDAERPHAAAVMHLTLRILR
jgi:hypothetical protein